VLFYLVLTAFANCPTEMALSSFVTYVFVSLLFIGEAYLAQQDDTLLMVQMVSVSGRNRLTFLLNGVISLVYIIFMIDLT